MNQFMPVDLSNCLSSGKHYAIGPGGIYPAWEDCIKITESQLGASREKVY
jgi:hypothetical protein